ncbi:alpha/beta-hydrolase [Meredithblackwellia eburnea MCA 4105]
MPESRSGSRSTRSSASLLLLTILATLVSALPTQSITTSTAFVPVPVVIWHGLGDRYDNVGLQSLKDDIQARKGFENVFVYFVRISDDGGKDQQSTFFGNANSQVEQVCEQLQAIPEIVEKDLNPSGQFDAVGFSQGGQLIRAVVERCVGTGGLSVRNLITVGSQHMGVSAVPPCPPGSSPFSSCRLMHLGIVREGLYSNWAQSNIVPAQYFRDEARLDDYFAVNNFLRDINNEREGDEEVGPVPDELVVPRTAGATKKMDDDEPEPRNATYKKNLESLSNLILLRFSEDATVVPPQSAHFTLPSPTAKNCPTPPSPDDLLCYRDPVPFSELPLYKADYIGLKTLDEAGKVHFGICEGQHMEIKPECWDLVVSWLGEGKGKLPKKADSSFVLQG